MKKSILPILISIIVSACALTPAQTSQLDSLVTTVAPLVASYAATGQVNYAQAIPVALNSIAIFAPAAKVNTATLAPLITNTVAAFTNKSGAPTGQKIASAIIAALPPTATGTQINTALTNAGIGASVGSNPGTSAMLHRNNRVALFG